MLPRILRSAEVVLVFALFIACVTAAVICHGSQPDDRLVLAQAESARLNRPLVVSIGATWCQPCHEFERTEVTMIRENAIYLHLDIDADAAIIARLPRVECIPALFVWEVPLIRGAILTVPKVVVGLIKIRLYVKDFHERHQRANEHGRDRSHHDDNRHEGNHQQSGQHEKGHR
jgi:hypothetical protein